MSFLSCSYSSKALQRHHLVDGKQTMKKRVMLYLEKQVFKITYIDELGDIFKSAGQYTV